MGFFLVVAGSIATGMVVVFAIASYLLERRSHFHGKAKL
jgi:hypothetical protein